MAQRESRTDGMVAPLVAAVIFAAAAIAVTSTLLSVGKSRSRMGEYEVAAGEAAKQLELLLNLEWNHPLVIPGDSGTDALHCLTPDGQPASGNESCSDIEIVWRVRNIGEPDVRVGSTPRARRIEVIARHRQKNSRQLAAMGTQAVGLKFYDYGSTKVP